MFYVLSPYRTPPKVLPSSPTTPPVTLVSHKQKCGSDPAPLWIAALCGHRKRGVAHRDSWPGPWEWAANTTNRALTLLGFLDRAWIFIKMHENACLRLCHNILLTHNLNGIRPTQKWTYKFINLCYHSQGEHIDVYLGSFHNHAFIWAPNITAKPHHSGGWANRPKNTVSFYIQSLCNMWHRVFLPRMLSWLNGCVMENHTSGLCGGWRHH